MDKEQYQAFKRWLIENDKTTHIPYALKQWDIQNGSPNAKYSPSDVIDWLFAVNNIIDKDHCRNKDLFLLIKSNSMSEIFKLQNNYRIRNKSVFLLDFLLSLSFEYLQQPFESYKEYVASETLSRASCNTLFLHRGNIACLKYKHPLEDVNVPIVTDLSVPIFVHANRCLKCNITFIRKEEIIRLREIYPFLVSNFCELSYDGYTPVDEGPFSVASPLMICGYNVKNNDLTEYQRHALLTNIIYNGILSKAEIIQYLEHFIGFNGSKNNMYAAVCKWENDLEFVRRLNIESHPIVEVTKIKPYYTKKI